MSGNLFAKIMRYLDTCAQFFLAHRDNLGAGVSDEFVTRDVEFHIVDVFAAAKTYGANDLVDTIRDHPEALGVHMRLPLVSKTTCRGDFRSGGFVTWSGEIAVFNFLSNDDINPHFGRRRRIAACKAVIENESRVAARPEEMFLGRDFAEVLIA
jgi:hypothetical protein